MKKEDVYHFLKDQPLCVISTSNKSDYPESAVVAFSVDEDLQVLIGTAEQSRKFKNITEKPKVALVFGFDGDKTLQYEGTVRMPEEGELKEKLKDHYKKYPDAVKYESIPGQVYMVVEPTWVRLSKSDPIVLGEIRFD